MNQPMPVAEQRKNALVTFNTQLPKMGQEFGNVLPPHISAKHFVRVLKTAVQNDPVLLECEPRSLWNAAMRAAQDGLLPDGRQGVIVRFKSRKAGVYLAQWIVMVAGLRQKIRNSGEIATLDVEVVRDRDVWTYERGDNPRIEHTPARGNRGHIIAAYSVARFKSGEISREWMWAEEIEEIRARSRSPDDGPWKTDYGEMCKKTVAKRHAKVLPMSTDVLGIIRRDDELLGMRDIPPRPELPTEPHALTDALNLLAGGPQDDEPADEHLEQVQGEQIPPQGGEGQVEQNAAEADAAEVSEAAERVRYMTELNDASARGELDIVYRRMPVRWRKALEVDYRALKYREGGS